MSLSTSCTDLLRLNEKRLFKDIRRSLSSGTKETRNVLEIRDNVLYVWNADKCCVLTLNVAAARGKLGEDLPYQVSDTLFLLYIYIYFCVVHRGRLCSPKQRKYRQPPALGLADLPRAT